MSDDLDDVVSQGGGHNEADLKNIGQKWIERIRASEKREDRWIKDAEQAEAAYLCGSDDDILAELPDFNILHSNVETIVPSIFNSTPVPDIRPRHAEKDKLAAFVSEVYERAIATQIDDSRLNAEIEASAQDAFMAGRGVVRIKFDADVEDVPAQTQMVPVGIDDMGQPVMHPMEIAPATQKVTNERLLFEVVSWRDYREGPAKRWDAVPWVAFRHSLSQQELDQITDKGISAAYSESDARDDELDADVWEVWCRDLGKVYFVANDSCKVLSINDDPLGLAGFFPMAAPVQPITGTGKRVPVCPYRVYKTLAGELDTISKRIRAITKGLKLKGLVASEAADIENFATAEDNTLTIAANMEGIGAIGGLEKAIAWWPIDKAVAVLRELYVAREQVKQAIYEITGISDIIRGQSSAQETATAQQIKTQWGSLRIKKMQRLIERQVRDIFVISAEIIASKFSAETLQKMTGLQIPPEAQAMFEAPLDHYRIDVESDSTVRADMTRNRGEMSEFLRGTAEFFGTMGPLVQQNPAAAGPIAEMYAAFARQFSLGKQAEDAIDQMAQMAKKAAENPPPNPQAEAQKAELQMKQQELQLKSQEIQGKSGLAMAKLQADVKSAQLDVALKAADLQLKDRQLGLQGDALTLEERKAEVDAISRAVEMNMEQAQQRAVKIGN